MEDVVAKFSPHRRSNKVIVSMTIDPDQCEDLDALATLRRTSLASLIREAVDLYLLENSRYSPSRPAASSDARPEQVPA